jgi:hypothetical protein
VVRRLEDEVRCILIDETSAQVENLGLELVGGEDLVGERGEREVEVI